LFEMTMMIKVRWGFLFNATLRQHATQSVSKSHTFFFLQMTCRIHPWSLNVCCETSYIFSHTEGSFFFYFPCTLIYQLIELKFKIKNMGPGL
jgi:hypothetical protein